MLHFGAAEACFMLEALVRIDMLPDDGPLGPKHVGALNLVF